ncbi:hypothetical protein MTsDn5_36070 [Alteromonas gracilis]|uniref:hypothetical protein n=1 Tax=Alteromonas gracilis TaxID=1479524 RepID=UPI0036F327DF
MIEIPESGVTFGPFQTDSIFQIEKSTNLPQSSKPVEFVFLSSNNKSLVLVEAKSSFSKPENNIDFDKNLNEIYQKIVDSISVLLCAHIGRHSKIREELPEKIKSLNWAKIDIKIRLVIPSFHKEWLPPITDALRNRLRHFLQSTGIPYMNFQVLNQELALKQNLIKK